MKDVTVQAGARKTAKMFLPFTKVDEETHCVWGYASTETMDMDGDSITLDALKESLPGYMISSPAHPEPAGPLREMHQLQAAGRVPQAEVDERGLYIRGEVVDPLAWEKVKKGTYRGFSVGGNATKRDPKNPHIITGLQLVEVSLVDRGSNPDALIELFKATETKPMLEAATETKEAASQADDVTSLRQTLLDAVSSLTDDEVKQSAAALAKAQAKPAKVEKAEVIEEGEVLQDPPPAPAHKAVSIAKLLKASGPKPALFKSLVGAALDMSDKQLASPLALSEAGLTNWLGNNPVFLEQINKACESTPFDPAKVELESVLVPVNTKLAKEAPEFVKVLETLDTAKAADDKDEKPKGDYGDVEYADPGYQDDKKPRYPIDNEAHVRAAWNYISKDKNQSKYSSDQVDKIKSKIIAAWKEHIDKDGPPSVDDKKEKASQPNPKDLTMKEDLGPDAKGNLRKGLMTASSAIYLLGCLDEIQESLEEEAAIEGDNSAMPQRFEQLVRMMSAAVEELLSEEVEEMLNDKEAEDFQTQIMWAADSKLLKSLAKGFTPKGAEYITKALGDKTGSPGFDNLTKFAEEIIAKGANEMAGDGDNDDWPADRKPKDNEDSNDDWKRKSQSIHDAAVAMGATCSMEKASKKEDAADDERDPPAKEKDKPKAKAEKASKKDKPAADEEEGETGADDEGEEDKPKKTKKSAEPDPRDQILNTLVDTMKAMHEDLVSMRRDPPRPKGALRSVEKSQDFSPRDKADPQLDSKDPKEVLKAVRNNPNFLNYRS